MAVKNHGNSHVYLPWYLASLVPPFRAAAGGSVAKGGHFMTAKRFEVSSVGQAARGREVGHWASMKRGGERCEAAFCQGWT